MISLQRNRNNFFFFWKHWQKQIQMPKLNFSQLTSKILINLNVPNLFSTKYYISIFKFAQFLTQILVFFSIEV